MAEKSTIARPYAKAFFELAFEQKKMGVWSEQLAVAAATAADERVAKLFNNPRLTATQLSDLLIGIVEDVGGKANVDETLRNFIRTLASNRRLGHLPEIALAFARLRAESENTAEVNVTSAVPLNPEQQKKYASMLEKRLKRDIRLHCEVDPSLLGGAILQAGDLVIDGSLRGRLERLSAEVTG